MFLHKTATLKGLASHHEGEGGASELKIKTTMAKCSQSYR